MAWRLSAADYPSIRAAIDVSLSEGSLPDAVIGLPIYAGYGEQAVLSSVPDADTATQDRQDHLHTAAILFTAAAIALALPSFTRESGPEFNAEIQRVAPAELAADLRLRAQAEVAAAAPEAVIGLVPLTFTVGKGSRGQW